MEGGRRKRRRVETEKRRGCLGVKDELSVDVFRVTKVPTVAALLLSLCS